MLTGTDRFKRGYADDADDDISSSRDEEDDEMVSPRATGPSPRDINDVLNQLGLRKKEEPVAEAPPSPPTKEEKEAEAQVAAARIAQAASQRALEEAEEAADRSANALSSNAADLERVDAKLAAAEQQLAKVHKTLAHTLDGSGGGASGSGESGDSSDEEEMARRKAQAAALEKISKADLDEVRTMHKPPALVRRSLELVQALLHVAGGKEGLPGGVGADAPEAPWVQLQQMIARTDFIKSVLRLKPWDIALRPQQLERLNARWPIAEQAERAPTAQARRRSRAPLVDDGAGGGGARTVSLGGAAHAARFAAKAAAPRGARGSAAEVAPRRRASRDLPASSSSEAAKGATSKPKSSVASASASAAAPSAAAPSAAAAPAAATAAAAPSGPQPLTAEGVQYASVACGALFRFCAALLATAARLVEERAAAKAREGPLLRELEGLRRERAAVAEYREKLLAEGAQLAEQARLAQEQLQRHTELLEYATKRCRDASLAHGEAREERLKREAEERRREERERRKAEREAARREQQRKVSEQIDRDLAERAAELEEERLRREEEETEQLGQRLAWLRADKEAATAPQLRAVEFEADGAVVSADGKAALAHAARALQQRSGRDGAPQLRLHIAGHAHADEDPRLSSQRAQAVGAALIAMGAPPAALRAKGYGATVPLSASQRARLRLRSERRTSLHPIGEIETKYGLEFARDEAELDAQARRLLADVAMLLKQNGKLKLSVEGHTDARGEPAANMQLATARAAQVCQALHTMGISPSRLVSHGFGATLPIADNATAEGRQRNRRVAFLVMPDPSRIDAHP